jgi:hypothetical protein
MGSISQCNACKSANLIEAIGETCVHLPGLNGLKADPLIVYPKMLICFDCGSIQSSLSDGELEKVKQMAAKVKAVSA